MYMYFFTGNDNQLILHSTFSHQVKPTEQKGEEGGGGGGEGETKNTSHQIALTLKFVALCSSFFQYKANLYLNVWSTINKLVFPKVVVCTFDQLNESDEESPGMGADHNQPLQQISCDLFLNHFRISVCKQW